MDVKKIILLVGALIVAGLSAFLVRSLLTNSSTPQVQAQVAEQSGPKVLVATTALPTGTILTAESFKYQPWPKDLIENAYYLEGEATPASLAGKVVRVSVPAGQPITKGGIVGPGERGFLAAALTPGMRAVTVPIDVQSGVAGFLFPGDRVDVVLTHSVAFNGSAEDGGSSDPLKVAETILRNVRILAIDQRTNDLGGEESGPQTGRTVTFEVSPKLVEKIAVAQTLGQLSLSLRPIADNTQELEQAIADGEIDVADNQDAKADKRMMLAMSAYPSDRSPTFTTGGEVSRFAANHDPRPAAVRAIQRSGATVRVFRGGATTEVAVGAN